MKLKCWIRLDPNFKFNLASNSLLFFFFFFFFFFFHSI